MIEAEQDFVCTTFIRKIRGRAGDLSDFKTAHQSEFLVQTPPGISCPPSTPHPVPVHPVPLPVHDVVYGGVRDVGLLFVWGLAGMQDRGTVGPGDQCLRQKSQL